MKDWEAAVAAMMYAKYSLSDAVTTIKTYKHAIYLIPAVILAFQKSNSFAATYIYNQGVQKGAVGISNNGSTNVVNMAKTTLQMVWMKAKAQQYADDDEIAGFYVFRGSTFDCPHLCDPQVGFHKKEDIGNFPPYHPHCCCGVMPIYKIKEETEEETE